MAILALAALGVACIGYLDARGAQTLAARITGVVLLAVGLLSLTAVALSWHKKELRVGWAAAVVAATALLLVGGAGALAVMWPRQFHLAVVGVVASLVVVVAVATLVLAWRHRPPLRSAAGRSGDPTSRAALIGATATISGALLALPLTWYTAHYRPAHAAPGVSITASLSDLREHEGRGAVTITVGVENTGDTSVRLIGSLYTLAGARTIDAGWSALDAPKVEAATREDYGPGARANALTDSSYPELVQFGQVVLDQSTLVPDESTKASVIAFFPLDAYDVLRLGADLVIARDDRLSTSAPHLRELDAVCAGTVVQLSTWAIEPGSTVERLTAARREVMLGRVLEDLDPDGRWWPATPYLAHQVQHEQHDCDHLFDEDGGGLEAQSMVGQAGAMSEILVPADLGTASSG